MYTKEIIYNLALGALLLQRQIANAVTDPSNEAKVLNTHYETALRSTLADLDLDSTSSQVALSLLSDEAHLDDYPEWKYVYAYPSNCSFFRRIKSCTLKDNRSSHIPKKIGVYSGQRAIFTDKEDAIAEIIPHDISLSLLSAPAGVCVAYRLATLSAPLIVGKGAQKLRQEIEKKYVVAKAEALQLDQRENFNFTPDDIESEFVEARMS